ncbi:hypothetical protein [Ruminococcus sp.]|uniref:hypothetical protein n=1 Tax=Ruminococcus sp. TaxID=41978 RepID=UPI00388F574A
MELFKRTIFRIFALALVFAAAFGILIATGKMTLPSVDAVSKATGEIISRDEVEGSFTVLINKDLHRDAKTLAEWEKFFRGEPYGYIFEDITCYVSTSDASGWEMAEGLRSRLPENQMKLKGVIEPMIADKIRHGIFDVAVFSDGAVKQLGMEDILKMPNVDVLQI